MLNIVCSNKILECQLRAEYKKANSSAKNKIERFYPGYKMLFKPKL